MKKTTIKCSAFSLVETLIGLSLLAIVIFAGSNILKPLNKANKKMRIFSAMARIENEIRAGVYLQSNYADPTAFSISIEGREVARHGKIIFVNDTLSESSETQPLDIRVNVSALPFSGGTRLGVIYQIAPNDSSVKLKPLGVQVWPANENDQKILLEGELGLGTPAVEASFSAIAIPDTLSQSNFGECEQGFVRGVDSQGRIKCWEMSATAKCPNWSVPVGFRLTDVGSKLELLCQKLNQLSCENLNLNIILPAARQISLPNFYVLNSLNLKDLFPSKSLVRGGLSKCESIIDFDKYGTGATIPASYVSSQSVNGIASVCPDSNLYIKNGAGDCAPNFNPSSVPIVIPATITSAPAGLVLAQ